MSLTVAPLAFSSPPPERAPSIVTTARRPRRVHGHDNALVGLLHAARPHQWVKNAVVLMIPALVLVSHGTTNPVSTLIAVAAFCLASSSVYLLNDTLDREADRHHPVKRHRPIASGVVPPALAITASAVAAISALVMGWLVTPPLGAIIAAYLLLTAAYSFGLKRLAWVDVTLLAAGFALRVTAGATAAGVGVSPLLLTAVFAGAVLVALGKRRSELVLLGDDAVSHRPALGSYRLTTIDTVSRGIESAAVVAFGLWVLGLEFGSAGAGLGLLGAVGFLGALDSYRRRLLRGGGSDPSRELFTDPAIIPGLLVAGLVVLTAGII